MLATSTPSLCSFDPSIIPYQLQVMKGIRKEYDYSLGLHEVLLSGSVGCLREDALVQTASGEVPIADIDGSKRLLSFHEKSGQFAFVPSSGAFPKGKDYLYRVISEHGEYVASGNHLLATSPYTYSRISDLVSAYSQIEVPHVQLKKHHGSSQLLLIEGVLRCSEILLSFLGHCAKHIRQCDQQLLLDLDNVLERFPSQVDAPEYGLFFCLNKFAHAGDQLALERELGHNAGVPFHQSMQNFLRLLASTSAGGEDVYTQADSKFYERTLRGILLSLLSDMHNVHPQEMRLTLSFLLPALSDALDVEVGYTKSTILKIERLDKQDWYWDIQVPNTHNYVANGYQHHNSSKSTLLAHIAITHCLNNMGARFLIGRLSMPALRSTIFQKILEHIGNDLVEEKDYRVNLTTAGIKFKNGSEIISRSWADKKYFKVRSLELSGAAIEESSENPDSEFYSEIKMRVGRLPHVKENIIVHATNPGAPDLWLYKYFSIGEPEKRLPTRHVYYSVTTDNPFLPAKYIEQLKAELDPKMARRMIYGEWIEITSDVVYYEYQRELQFIKRTYEVNPHYPVICTFDFNIGGPQKPMSMCLAQYIEDEFHFFDEVIISGARTADTIDELDGRGLLRKDWRYQICGDASGKHRDTRSSRSDYDIITGAFQNRGLSYEYHVPLANPSIRLRHNRVNAYCKNALGQTRLWVYEKCAKVDEGLRLVKLKPGANYIEDDSKDYQHCTSALGYAVVFLSNQRNKKQQGTTQL